MRIKWGRVGGVGGERRRRIVHETFPNRECRNDSSKAHDKRHIILIIIPVFVVVVVTRDAPTRCRHSHKGVFLRRAADATFLY